MQPLKLLINIPPTEPISGKLYDKFNGDALLAYCIAKGQ